MQDLKEVLEKKEKILWEGKPLFVPFLLSGITITTVFGLFILSQFLGQVGYITFRNLISTLFLPIYIGIAIVFGPIIYRLLSYKNTYYLITNRRVLIQGGVIAKDYKTIDFDQITNAAVNIDIFDKLFGNGSGSIIISTAGNFTSQQSASFSGYSLNNVSNPYKVFKFFEKVAQDIKTDMYYPNKLRPAKNPGYKTDYEPK